MNQHMPVSLRIERLPDCKFLAWQAVVISIAMFAETVEVNAFGFILPIVQKEFALNPALMGYLGSGSLFGMLIGALFCSVLADKLGRKKLFIICMITWGLAGIIFALAPNIIVLFIARVIFGIGAGAQVPASLALLAEMSPASSRAKYVALSLMAVPVSVWFGASVASFILSISNWRVMFVIISCLSLWVIMIIKSVPESARWLESKGRIDEADEVIAYFESRVEKSAGKTLSAITDEEVERFQQQCLTTSEITEQKHSFVEIWSAQHLRHTLLGIIWSYLQMLSYFALATWLTALLVTKGFSVVKSTSMIAVFAIGGIPAYFVMVWLLNRYGRKVAAVVMSLLTAGTAYAYGNMDTFTTIVIAGFIYQFCQYGYNMCYSTYLSELMPTYLRGTGVGLFQALGRVGGISGSIIIGYIMSWGGYGQVFLVVVACNVLSAIFIIILGKETKHVVA